MLSVIDEKNTVLTEENCLIKKKLNEYDLKINIYKEKNSDSYLRELKKYQLEYEKLICDMKDKKNDVKNRENFYKEEINRLNGIIDHIEKNVKNVNSFYKFQLKLENSVLNDNIKCKEIELENKEQDILEFKNKLKNLYSDNNSENFHFQNIIKERDEVIRNLREEVKELIEIKKKCYKLMQNVEFQ